jgi:RNA polymerase sigma factor (sigma-70 family)
VNADPAVVRAAQTGDDAATEALFREAWPEAYRIALAITGEPGRAEDAAQQAFFQAWRGLPRLRQPEAFVPWLWRLVGREARRALKERREQPEAEVAAPRTEHPADVDLAAALATLSEGDQRLVTLAYGVELSSAEIARVLGLPASTVRFRLGRIRAQLRQALDGSATARAMPRLVSQRGGGSAK